MIFEEGTEHSYTETGYEVATLIRVLCNITRSLIDSNAGKTSNQISG